MKWARDNNFKILTLPGVSLDLSILETIAAPIKKEFHSKRCTIEKAAAKRFEHIFKNELEQEQIRYLYRKYTKRLHDCKRAKGQITKY